METIESEIGTLLNNIMNKAVLSQRSPIAAKLKDDIKTICSNALDNAVEQTSPMTIERLVNLENMKRES